MVTEKNSKKMRSQKNLKKLWREIWCVKEHSIFHISEIPPPTNPWTMGLCGCVASTETITIGFKIPQECSLQDMGNIQNYSTCL
jgi:hypothetical protein